MGAKTLKVLMMLCMVALAGCSYFISIDEVARHIEAQMQREFNANTEYKHYHLIVDDVQITERKGDEFKAISKLKYQGKPFVIDVKIEKMDSGFSWKIEQDAFAFIDEIEIEKYKQQLDRELEQISVSLDQEDTMHIAVEDELTQPEAMNHTVKSYDEKPYPVGNITAYSK